MNPSWAIGLCSVLCGLATPALAQSQARAPASAEQLALEVRRLRAENDSLRRLLAPNALPAPLGPSSQSVVVMARLESYSAPLLSAESPATTEPYSVREAAGVAVPTKPLALAMDVCQSIKQELDENALPLRVTHDQVKTMIDLYLTRDWKRVSGYRPWTHTQFVRSLTSSERQQLVREIVQVLHSGRLLAREC